MRFTVAVYIAAALGAIAAALLLLLLIQNEGEYDSPATVWVIVLSVALTVYIGLAVFAKTFSSTHARRRWATGFALASLAFGILGGGLGGLAFFGPSTVILMWLAIRG